MWSDIFAAVVNFYPVWSNLGRFANFHDHNKRRSLFFFILPLRLWSVVGCCFDFRFLVLFSKVWEFAFSLRFTYFFPRVFVSFICGFFCGKEYSPTVLPIYFTSEIKFVVQFWQFLDFFFLGIYTVIYFRDVYRFGAEYSWKI